MISNYRVPFSSADITADNGFIYIQNLIEREQESVIPSTAQSHISEFQPPIIVSASFAHPDVPVHERERLAIPEERLPDALARGASHLPGKRKELVVVSTCLRHEVTTVGIDHDELKRLICIMSGVDRLPEGGQFLYGRKSVEHVFRVTAGMLSPVVGEPEVLGQVRSAHRAARKAGLVGPSLDELFREAIRTGRDSRDVLPAQDTGSIATIAAKHLSDLPRLPQKRLALVGAGAMANAVFQHLAHTEWEIERFTRTPERLGPDALGFDKLEQSLSSVDAVVTAVRAPLPLVTRDMLQRLQEQREKILLLLDLGMPSNVAHHADLIGLDKIDYFDIDRLATDKRWVVSTAQSEALIATRAVETHARIVNSSLTPLIKALREKASQAVEEELSQAFSRLGDLTQTQKNVIQQMGQTLANRLLHDPLLYLSSHPQAVATSGTAERILGISSTSKADACPDVDHTELPAKDTENTSPK